jgi:hypothetical protein
MDDTHHRLRFFWRRHRHGTRPHVRCRLSAANSTHLGRALYELSSCPSMSIHFVRKPMRRCLVFRISGNFPSNISSISLAPYMQNLLQIGYEHWRQIVKKCPSGKASLVAHLLRVHKAQLPRSTAIEMIKQTDLSDLAKLVNRYSISERVTTQLFDRLQTLETDVRDWQHEAENLLL